MAYRSIKRIHYTPNAKEMKPRALFVWIVLFTVTNPFFAQQDIDPVFDRGCAILTRPASIKEPFFLPNKLIQPPVYAWDSRKTIYGIDGNQGGVLRYSSGTIICIPPAAFLDEAGNPVSGQVQIDYREFKDPLDFVFSGIPMTYDSGGTVHNFESAGMFDIAASQDGRQVFLAPDKPVRMEFV
jgi:hypothetical protein